MIDFIKVLVQKGVAYEGSDGVYLSVQGLPHSDQYKYGELSGQKQDQMLEGVRVPSGEGKRDPLDFALWKKAKPEEPSWESPWGPGRPGWHIECSTMSTALLGDAFDIHGGGQDLVFPHHENELAQARGAGKRFARIWLHNGLLTVNGQKMSKSVGNIVRIQDVLARHPADVLRLFYLSAHYRSPIDFTWEELEAVARAYNRWMGFLQRVQHDLGQGESESLNSLKDHDPREPQLLDAGYGFFDAMDDDLNTPQALACLSMVEGAASDRIAKWSSGKSRTRDDLQFVRLSRDKFIELGRILGFTFPQQEVPEVIRGLIRKRDEARRQKRFDEADHLRKQIMEEGYLVEDSADGTVVRKRV